MVASGTFGYGKEVERFTDVKKLGAVVAKTVTLNPCVGNPPPRIAEVTAGMLNAIGLQNDGAGHFIEEKIPYLKELKIPVIVSISGSNEEEWRELAKKFDRIKEVSAIELNLSCPNIHYSPHTSPLPLWGEGWVRGETIGNGLRIRG